MRGWARTLLLALLLVLVGPACVAMFLENRLIYFPARGGVGASPGEELELVTADGVSLHAWWIPGPATGPAVLHLHGNAGNLEHRREIYRELAALGASVLALDYRGYGRSAGRPAERGLYADARAAHAWLAARVPPERIVLYGESLGAGPACQLALETPVGGLILQSAFTSIPDMARSVVPWMVLPRLFLDSRFDNLAKVGRIDAPKLLLHSRGDEVVPFAHAQRLARAAKPPLECDFVDTAGHNDPPLGPRGAFQGSVTRFLARWGG